jgi:hypothetical protein
MAACQKQHRAIIATKGDDQLMKITSDKAVWNEYRRGIMRIINGYPYVLRLEHHSCIYVNRIVNAYYFANAEAPLLHGEPIGKPLIEASKALIKTIAGNFKGVLRNTMAMEFCDTYRLFMEELHKVLPPGPEEVQRGIIEELLQLCVISNQTRIDTRAEHDLIQATLRAKRQAAYLKLGKKKTIALLNASGSALNVD